MKKTVLSLTPVSLERDSRTLKLAASFARKGYRSIVFEHIPSQRNFDDLGIEIFKTSKTNAIINLPKKNILHRFLMKVAKYAWHGMRSIGLGAINDRITFKKFKRHSKEEYSLDRYLIPQADIYIFHSYEYVDFALKLPEDSLIIYDAHDFYQEIGPLSTHSSVVKKWLLPYQKTRESTLINRANIFSTVSNGLSYKYKDTFLKKPTVVHNAHDPRIDVSIQKGVREFLHLKEDDIIVCCVGNKKEGMAFKKSLEAFKQLPGHYHLVFLGNGYEELEEGESNIHFISAIPPDEIVPFIATADIGIILYFDLTENYKYALPNRFFQMLAAGLPIVFPQQLKEICALHEKFSFGIQTNINDVDSMLKSLKDLAKNKVRYKKNVNKFNEVINWASEEKKVFSLVNSLNKLS